MTVYLGKDRKLAIPTMTATHATVTGLTGRIENLGHKLYMDSFFSSPELFDDLHTKAINCCGTVRQNRRGMPTDFQKTLKLTRDDIKTRVRGDLTAVVWKDKRNVNLLTNMHPGPADGNFCDEHGNTVKPKIAQDYSKHMAYVDKRDRMTNSYAISRRTWKWTKKLFFHLLDLTILNNFILLASCGAKVTHSHFRLTLIKDLIQEASRVPRIQTALRGIPTPTTEKVTRLYFRQNTHWPRAANRYSCRLCSAADRHGRRSSVRYAM
jgi:hypothetical protein